MERSRMRTPIIQRSKGACTVGLVVSLGCALFGVGGAAAGDGKYARHAQEARVEARLTGAALAHRTPEQLVLAITPKSHLAPAGRARREHSRPRRAPAPAAARPAPAAAAAPAASTTPTDTTAQPATSTPATTTDHVGADQHHPDRHPAHRHDHLAGADYPGGDAGHGRHEQPERRHDRDRQHRRRRNRHHRRHRDRQRRQRPTRTSRAERHDDRNHHRNHDHHRNHTPPEPPPAEPPQPPEPQPRNHHQRDHDDRNDRRARERTPGRDQHLDHRLDRHHVPRSLQRLVADRRGGAGIAALQHLAGRIPKLRADRRPDRGYDAADARGSDHDAGYDADRSDQCRLEHRVASADIALDAERVDGCVPIHTADRQFQELDLARPRCCA